jgi:hypothetical protein
VARVAPGSIKSEYLVLILSFVPNLAEKMEVVVDYNALKGAYDETIIKELSIASDGVIQAFHFRCPYTMTPNTRGNKSSDTGIHWDDSHISYSQLSTVLSEAVPKYPHLCV